MTGFARHRTGFGTLLARAQSECLAAFVVPGLEVAQAYGLNLQAAGLDVVATPRHASVLVLVGEIPSGLAEAAAVAYSQMPRPRLLFAVGGHQPASLPAVDVAVPADQTALSAGVAALRERFREGGFDASDHDTSLSVRGSGKQSASGNHHNGAEHPGMAEMGHGGSHAMHAMDMGQGESHAMHDMDMGEGGSHAMHDMDMDMGGGFMSMVMMTRDLPRSADGLPMEWLDVPFGPLFPGLPGGLALTLTLDGDTVARATVEWGTLTRDLQAHWPGPVEGFVERFARVDPLSPEAYRALAERALLASSGSPADPAAGRARVRLLESERAASHLAWLARFAFLLGNRWLEARSTEIVTQLREADDRTALRRVRHEAGALVRQVHRTPLLASRLGGVGVLEQTTVTDLDGPVARASGAPGDARSDDPAYQELGFEPAVLNGGDALARLRLRLAELEQSLELVLASPADARPSRVPPPADGGGEATVETPRGSATLRIRLDHGEVTQATLHSPSQRLARVIRPVSEGHELADALLGIASLDLSPWEIDR
jgi:Ni,Fe-hydrogenase III large subunit